MTTATIPETRMRLVPAPEAEPAVPGLLDRLRWQVDRMERTWMVRRGRRGLGRHVPVRVARDVLVEVQDVVALVGLHLPVRHPMQQLVALVCDAIDHEAGRDPRIDDSPQHRRRVARIAAAMAAETAGGAA